MEAVHGAEAVERHRRDRFAGAFAGAERVVCAGFAQEPGELLTAQASDVIVRPADSLQPRGNLDERSLGERVGAFSGVPAGHLSGRAIVDEPIHRSVCCPRARPAKLAGLDVAAERARATRRPWRLRAPKHRHSWAPEARSSTRSPKVELGCLTLGRRSAPCPGANAVGETIELDAGMGARRDGGADDRGASCATAAPGSRGRRSTVRGSHAATSECGQRPPARSGLSSVQGQRRNATIAVSSVGSPDR
jgi:hypothetical protein